MIKYSQAYCLELGRIITKHELWALLLGPDRIKKVLTFRCPEQGCDARLIVQKKSHQSLNFKSFPGTQHQPGCHYLKGSDRRFKAYRDSIKQNNKYDHNISYPPLQLGPDLILPKDRVVSHPLQYLTDTPCLKRAA